MVGADNEPSTFFLALFEIDNLCLSSSPELFEIQL